MIRDLIKEMDFLKEKCEDASREDESVIVDLKETLKFHSDKYIGLPANIIGVNKRIIVVIDEEGDYIVFVNPKIIKKEKPYEADEGCICFEGHKPTLRYRTIEVEYLDENFEERREVFTGVVSQVIQHEINHIDGKII